MSEVISSIAYGDASTLESLADMTMNTLAQSALDTRTYAMVRIAALVAMNAPAESYAISLGADETDVEAEDLEGILIALAPVVGAARIATGAFNLLDTFFDGAEVQPEGVEADPGAQAESDSLDATDVDTPTESPAIEEDASVIRIFDTRIEPIEVEDLADSSDFEDAREFEARERESASEFETV